MYSTYNQKKKMKMENKQILFLFTPRQNGTRFVSKQTNGNIDEIE